MAASSPRLTGSAAAPAAVALAFASAGVTLYWTLGGTALLDTVGGSLEDAAREHDGSAVAFGSLTFAVKVLGGMLALALLEPWRRRLPHLVLRAARAAAVALVAYGTVNVLGATLGLAGVAGDDVDRTALWGHALLWDPWFILWGALLWRAARAPATGVGSQRTEAGAVRDR